MAERSAADPVWTLIENRCAGIPDPKRVKLLHSDIPLTFSIQADWLRGRRFPLQLSSADWLEELGRTAKAVRRASAVRRAFRW